MNPLLIGLHGKARSGKDLTCEYIKAWCEEAGVTAKRDAFADRLKISAARALGVKEGEIAFCNDLKEDRTLIQIRMVTASGGPNTLVHSLSGREYLQYYGTEAHREVFADDFWVDAVLPEASDPEGYCQWWDNFLVDHEVADVCVVTDVRFPNEAERVKNLGGVLWKIERDVAGVAGNHVSEQDLDPKLIDVVIDNNGSLKDLEEGVSALLTNYLSETRLYMESSNVS